MEPVRVVYITDENYALATCVSMSSVIKNKKNRRKYIIYILVNSISKQSKIFFKSYDNAENKIEIIEVDNSDLEALSKTCLAKNTYVSQSALIKLKLPDLLDANKVLYLDGDTIVQSDIAQLYDLNIKDFYVAAADDMGDSITLKGESFWASRIGITDRKYFNSGVMLLNLQNMREDSVAHKMMLFREHEKNYFMDQDALNKILGEKRLTIPYKYNFLSIFLHKMELKELLNNYCDQNYSSIEECINSQVIIHFADRIKPWEYNIPFISEIFSKYYNETPYGKKILRLESSMKWIRDFYEKQMANMLWSFPYEKIPKNSKIVVYGAGKVGQDLIRQLNGNVDYELVAWVDKRYDENRILSPMVIPNLVYDYLIVAVKDETTKTDITNDLLALGVKIERLVYVC